MKCRLVEDKYGSVWQTNFSLHKNVLSLSVVACLKLNDLPSHLVDPTTRMIQFLSIVQVFSNPNRYSQKLLDEAKKIADQVDNEMFRQTRSQILKLEYLVVTGLSCQRKLTEPSILWKLSVTAQGGAPFPLKSVCRVFLSGRIEQAESYYRQLLDEGTLGHWLQHSLDTHGLRQNGVMFMLRYVLKYEHEKLLELSQWDDSFTIVVGKRKHNLWRRSAPAEGEELRKRSNTQNFAEIESVQNVVAKELEGLGFRVAMDVPQQGLLTCYWQKKSLPKLSAKIELKPSRLVNLAIEPGFVNIAVLCGCLLILVGVLRVKMKQKHVSSLFVN